MIEKLKVSCDVKATDNRITTENWFCLNKNASLGPQNVLVLGLMRRIDYLIQIIRSVSLLCLQLPLSYLL